MGEQKLDVRLKGEFTVSCPNFELVCNIYMCNTTNHEKMYIKE